MSSTAASSVNSGVVERPPSLAKRKTSLRWVPALASTEPSVSSTIASAPISPSLAAKPLAKPRSCSGASTDCRSAVWPGTMKPGRRNKLCANSSLVG